MLTNRGTACYSAPEIHAQRIWNERVDLWSGGLSICFMLLGRLPFRAGRDSVRRALKSGLAPPMDFCKLPWLLGNLAQQCLAPDPCDRPPAVELLAHPAFGDGSARAAGCCARGCRDAG
ncbi:unnamed protein product [Prorocentrum cordatum]|uniref:Protein kinase domain-containing protein n=1 Tax=Prorocentrum cordatum TaxID=2364126 RepID=A0ABN9PT80_9DINO|nr:unnamed protein product [Polarella glacialis]